MATIKSYSDLEQSKKLAEILPLESADMIWDLTNPDLPTIRAIPYEDSDYNNKYLNLIAAWSLAALLGVLPHYTMINNGYSGIVIWSSYCHSNEHDNPVNACYELILKLYELNSL